MKPFAFYINEGKVKRASIDVELARALLFDAQNRYNDVLQLDSKRFPKIIFENSYDALRDLLDCLLALNGYKSYSHEASIAYLEKFNIELSVMLELDYFRVIRNSSKYYGKPVSDEAVKEIILFYAKFQSIIEKYTAKIHPED